MTDVTDSARGYALERAETGAVAANVVAMACAAEAPRRGAPATTAEEAEVERMARKELLG